MALGFLFLPDARLHLTAYLGLFFAGTVVSLLAARSLSGTGRGFLLLCGALFRVTLLLRSPDLSDDIYRYLWDGRVAASGVSPYRYVPDDPALDGISGNLRVRVGHRDVLSVYPPIAQAAFRVFGGRRESVVLLKAFFAAADLCVVWLLSSWGGEGGSFAAALYAFHPLPITEIAGQGHLDSLGVALLLACLVYLRSGRRAAAGLAFAASALTKYVSFAAAIPILRRGRWACLGSASLLAAAVWLSAARGGASPSGDFGRFATGWSFNSVLYPAAVMLMEKGEVPDRAKDIFIDWKERHHDPPWTQKVFPFFYPAFFARALLAILLGGVLLGIGWRMRETETAAFASIAALLLFSPTLHPWYLLWVLPLAAAAREPAFLYLSFACPLSYALLYPAAGVPATLVSSLEYVPFALLGIATILRRRTRAMLPEAV